MLSYLLAHPNAYASDIVIDLGTHATHVYTMLQAWECLGAVIGTVDATTGRPGKPPVSWELAPWAQERVR